MRMIQISRKIDPLLLRSGKDYDCVFTSTRFCDLLL